MWRIIALPMAALCLVLAVLHATIWPDPAIAIGAFLGVGVYVYMFIFEHRRYRNLTKKR